MLMDNLNKVIREFDMKVSAKKMKMMCISRRGNDKMKIYKFMLMDSKRVKLFDNLLYQLSQVVPGQTAKERFLSLLLWVRS